MTGEKFSLLLFLNIYYYYYYYLLLLLFFIEIVYNKPESKQMFKMDYNLIEYILIYDTPYIMVGREFHF